MYKRLILLCTWLLFIVACVRNEDAQTVASVTPTAVINTIVLPTPTVTLPPTITPQPTPSMPDIAVPHQILTDDGELQFSLVVSNEPSWLVIYSWENGELGAVLGHTAVSTGQNSDLTITIDPLQATPTLAVMLHVDQGQAGTFEFPDGPDSPLEFESARIAETFTPEFQLSTPVITVSDQEIFEDGLVYVHSVLALEPGWFVIHADDNGQLGPYLGSVPLNPGLNEDLTIHIPWRQGTSTLHALIYEDNGREQQLDLAEEDIPLLINGNMIVSSFSVTYPPDLNVLDQPVANGTFIVDRVYSNGPGWLVVYFDNEGEPGLIIGSVALADGVNENIVVDVLETAVTNPLHLRIHEDTEPGDAFDFPRVDPPIVYDGRQVRPYTFNTEPGNYLVVQDQEKGTETEGMLQVNVPTAVVNAPGWLVIHADNDGFRGDILGFTQLKAGLNQELTVSIPADAATDLLYAVLYLDADEIGEFEPETTDVPLQRNRRILEIPFNLLLSGTED